MAVAVRDDRGSQQPDCRCSRPGRAGGGSPSGRRWIAARLARYASRVGCWGRSRPPARLRNETSSARGGPVRRWWRSPFGTAEDRNLFHVALSRMRAGVAVALGTTGDRNFGNQGDPPWQGRWWRSSFGMTEDRNFAFEAICSLRRYVTVASGRPRIAMLPARWGRRPAAGAVAFRGDWGSQHRVLHEHRQRVRCGGRPSGRQRIGT